jgi:hypothetical protein
MSVMLMAETASNDFNNRTGPLSVVNPITAEKEKEKRRETKLS